MKKITIFAPSVRFAMGQYIEKHSNLLSDYYPITLVVPSHYNRTDTKANVLNFLVGEKLSGLLRNINPITHLKIWLLVYKSKPDILHIINSEGYPWSISLSIIAKILGYKIIITVHDPTPHPGSYIDIVASKLRPLTLILADKIHIHYEDINFINNRFYKNKIIVIQHLNFSDLFTQHIENNVKVDNDVLFFGRIEKYKGIELLIDACNLLQNKLNIIIAGPGKVSHQLATNIKNANITLINKYLTDKEVCALFQRTKTLVLPYLQSTQSSLPSIAKGFGVSIVATRTGNFISEIPKLGGILVECTPQDLAKGLEKSNANYKKHHIEPCKINLLIKDSFIKLYDEI